MANDADHEPNKATTQTLQQTIQLKFDTQNASEPKSSPNSMQPKLALPQLRIPKLNTTNSMICGLTIPKLRGASGEPLKERQFDIPLLNQLRNQNNSLEVNHGLAKRVSALKIIEPVDGGQVTKVAINGEDRATAPIDLTTAVIAVQKNAPPREAASKQRQKQSTIVEHFDIPFIRCDSNRLYVGLLFGKRHRCNSDKMEPPTTSEQIMAKPSDVGSMLSTSAGYPKSRRSQLKYAATPTELLHLEMYYREDYGRNIKRFRFDTPSPDELVKESLKKSLRILRT
ncbi:uncharacterized protein LOC6566213 [Drosophila grimshawi]|uniref:GH24863 n=1 Tax=Drosophila grimshawi TaxID=7222 RepID=B4JNQ6_DROGR|nr:uncharacterized protein LOC6566213 [Drosophila grimshawi]EDV92349.1 GH24863 [Drosophila grimshawi]